MERKAILLSLGLVALALAGCTAPADEEDGSAQTTSAPISTDTTLMQLRAIYVDKPFNGGQPTPEHTWLLPTADTMQFFHWNHADPSKATGLMFVGDGFRALGCVGPGGISQEQIDQGFVHFHKETDSNWDHGHHTSTDPSVTGWWLRHVGAMDGPAPMPGMPPIKKGEVYPMMPSHEGAPACA